MALFESAVDLCAILMAWKAGKNYKGVPGQANAVAHMWQQIASRGSY